MNAIEVREPAVGEEWAYRARYHDPLVQVVVGRFGVKRPRRVLVRFVSDEFEGLQDWVPPTRLKVPWSGVEEFVARERRWDAVVAPSPPDYDDPEVSAAGTVFDLLIVPEVAATGWNATRGIVTIHEVDSLAAFLDVDPVKLRADAISFEEDGDLISPWPVTLAIARRAAERDPHAVLRYVEKEEVDARREATYGAWHGRRGTPDDHISAEICKSADDKHGRPVRALLREWCGADAVDLRAEISTLRQEASRAAAVAQGAVELLRRHGHPRDANRLERELAAFVVGLTCLGEIGLGGATGIPPSSPTQALWFDS